MTLSSIGPILLIALVLVIAIFLIRKVGSHLAGMRPEVHDSDGKEVFYGGASEAAQVIHTLADAGIIGWSESEPDGQRRVFVEHEQHADIPALLAVQQQILQGQAAEQEDPELNAIPAQG